VGAISAHVKGFGHRPREGPRRVVGAGVRKPPREMLWGDGEDIAPIVADMNQCSVLCKNRMI